MNTRILKFFKSKKPLDLDKRHLTIIVFGVMIFGLILGYIHNLYETGRLK